MLDGYKGDTLEESLKYLNDPQLLFRLAIAHVRLHSCKGTAKQKVLH